MSNATYCDPIFVTPIRAKLPLTLYRAAFRIPPTEALNCDPRAPGRSVDRVEAGVAANLRRAINALKVDGVESATGRVNYTTLRESDGFRAYENAVRALQGFNPLVLASDAERKAFWINLYNALIIHAVITYDVQNKITEVLGVFERAAYIVGSYRFSANDIEHGILRANRGHPLIPGSRFRRGDPRALLALRTFDPRIHFALNCGATSCPPVGFYDADRIEQQLDRAAQHFIADGGLVLDRAAQRVKVSRIMSWFASDFGGVWFGYRKQDALLRALARYVADAADREFIEQHAGDLRVTFQPYDWSLNA